MDDKCCGGLYVPLDCSHNQRSRYAHGFYCNDCKTFFPVDSPTYRSGELLSSIWMVLHNLNAGRHQKGKTAIPEVEAMKNKIGIGKRHENHEELITEAEAIMKKHHVTAESATMTLGSQARRPKARRSGR